MPQQPSREVPMSIVDNYIVDNYVIDAHRIAEAFLARINRMADERARLRRSLISSVEVVEAADISDCAIRAHKTRS